jgi:hypothetical protein
MQIRVGEPGSEHAIVYLAVEVIERVLEAHEEEGWVLLVATDELTPGVFTPRLARRLSGEPTGEVETVRLRGDVVVQLPPAIHALHDCWVAAGGREVAVRERLAPPTPARPAARAASPVVAEV